MHQGKQIKLCQSRIATTDNRNLQPGRIQELTNEGIIVETGDGSIELLELQPECRQRMNARHCANGYCLIVNETLS
jgi:methionyl-tRNA formyltransferase